MSYYSVVNTFTRGTRALAAAITSEYAAIATAFGLVNDDVSALQAGSTPGFNAAIDTRWRLADTSASATAYAVTYPNAAGNAAFAGMHFRLADANQTNSAGAVTVNCGTTDGAIAIKVIDKDGAKQNPAAGDIDPDLDAVLWYDGTDFILENPVSHASSGGVTVQAAQTASFTATDPAGGHFVYPINASGGSVTATLPASWTGILEFVASAAAGTNDMIVNDSGATELYTGGYAIGDFYRVGSDGTTEYRLDEQSTVRGELFLTADDGIPATSEEKIFDEGYSEDLDLGSRWDAVTNHRYTALVAETVTFRLIGKLEHKNLNLYLKVDGAKITTVGGANQTENDGLKTYVATVRLAASSYVEVFAYSVDASTRAVMGDAGKDESRLSWEARRTR